MVLPGIALTALSQCFPASFLVEDNRVDLLIGFQAGPHDDCPDSRIHDHLGTEETGPDPGEFPGLDLEPGKVERASPSQFSGLEESVHLGMDAPALFVVGSGRDIVVFPPAPPQLRAVYLFPRCSRITGRDDGVILVHNDGSKIPAEAGSLVGAAEGKVKEVLVTIGSHLNKVGPVTDKRIIEDF